MDEYLFLTHGKLLRMEALTRPSTAYALYDITRCFLLTSELALHRHVETVNDDGDDELGLDVRWKSDML